MATVHQLEKKVSVLESKLSELSDARADVSRDVIKILTEDVQAHRDYIQKLYRSAATAGGVIVAGGVGLAFWILGEQLDAKVFEYRVVDSLRTEAEKISQEIVSTAKVEAQKSVKEFVETEISKEAAEQVKVQLASLNEETLAGLVNKITFPSGIVIATDSPECPPEWSSFTQADGRMIVGVGTTLNKLTDWALTGLGWATKFDLLDTGGVALGSIQTINVPTDSLNTTTVRVFVAPASEVKQFVKVEPVIHANLPPYIALNFCRKD